MKERAINGYFNYYDSIKKTLEKYYDTKLEVCSHGESIPKKNILFSYPRINAILNFSPGEKVKKYLYSMYNVRDNLIKKILAKCYISAIFALHGTMSRKIIYIKNNSLVNNETMIMSFNRRLRIFDFAKQSVVSIIKYKYPDKYFLNELNFRLKYKYEFVHPIESIGKTWYSEKILRGTSLARVSDTIAYDEYCRKALEDISHINTMTLNYIDCKTYVEKLSQDITTILGKSEFKENAETRRLLIKCIETAVEKAFVLNFSVPVALTHGDFQAGNLWIDSDTGKVIILDWETNGLRSIWYDSATLLLGTRRKGGMRKLMNEYNDQIKQEKILWNDSKKSYNMASVASILMLEEISFWLDDMCERPLENKNIAFDIFMDEISGINWGNII
jgi:hypothetical protein